VFFYHAEYVAGEPQLDNNEVVDYAWVTRDELKEYFEPELFHFVRDMLPA
jgi:large subunit ribosomal protein L46